MMAYFMVGKGWGMRPMYADEKPQRIGGVVSGTHPPKGGIGQSRDLQSTVKQRPQSTEEGGGMARSRGLGVNRESVRCICGSKPDGIPLPLGAEHQRET